MKQVAEFAEVFTLQGPRESCRHAPVAGIAFGISPGEG